MASWINRLLVDLGRNIVELGWADPWTSIPPMVAGDELRDRPLGWPNHDLGPDDPRHDGSDQPEPEPAPQLAAASSI